jgi:hypothetical protein
VLAFLFLLFLGLVKAAYLLGGLALFGHWPHLYLAKLRARACIRRESVAVVLAKITKFHGYSSTYSGWHRYFPVHIM